MIHVIATIELRPGTRAAYLAEFRLLVPKVKAEAGCLDYGPTLDARTDIAAQIPYRENAVTILEKWESLAHLKTHFTQPHMAEYRKNVQDFVKKVALQILEPA